MKKLLTIKKNFIMALIMGFMVFTSTSQAQNISKEQVIGEWKFVEVTIISPKAGYVPAFAKKEISLTKMCMANYNFNQDGSMVLSEKYMESNGVNSAGWELEGSTINITYNFNEDTPGHTNKSETLPWSILSVSKETLIIDLMGMFKVNLKR